MQSALLELKEDLQYELEAVVDAEVERQMEEAVEDLVDQTVQNEVDGIREELEEMGELEHSRLWAAVDDLQSQLRDMQREVHAVRDLRVMLRAKQDLDARVTRLEARLGWLEARLGVRHPAA